MGEGGIEAKKEFSGGSNLEDLVLVGGGGVGPKEIRGWHLCDFGYNMPPSTGKIFGNKAHIRLLHVLQSQTCYA